MSGGQSFGTPHPSTPSGGLTAVSQFSEENSTMANITRLRPDGDNDDGSDDKSLQAMTAKDLTVLFKKIRQARSDLDSARGTIGQLVTDAVENKHGHKGAIGVLQRLDKMSDAKREEMVFHLMAGIKSLKWDNFSDLFRSNPAAAAE
jgi:hypothetical protein